MKDGKNFVAIANLLLLSFHVNLELDMYCFTMLEILRRLFWDRMKILLALVSDSIFGPYENRRALRSRAVLVYPQFGIGDQLLSLSAYLQLAEKQKLYILLDPRIKVSAEAFIRHRNIQLLSADPLERRFGYSERKQYRSLAKLLNAKILSLSDLQIRIARYGRPHEHPNSIVYRILQIDPKTFMSSSVKDHLRNSAQSQYQPPDQRFALVDHFPGSSREIPLEVFERISNRGLSVKFAPKDVPFPELIDFVLAAEELHLVNSSFFCFCLIVNPQINFKSVYIIQNGYINGRKFYDASWNEFLLDLDESRFDSYPKELDRDFEYERERKLSRKLRRIIVNTYFSIIYRMDE